jgi:photoactive yellow protein
VTTAMQPEDHFTSNDVAADLEVMSREQMDALPFGVVRLDWNGDVRYFSEQEKLLSGYRLDPNGRNWLRDVAPCMSTPAFVRAMDAAVDSSGFDMTIMMTGDFVDPNRVLEIRIVAASVGSGFWLLIRRVE